MVKTGTAYAHRRGDERRQQFTTDKIYDLLTNKVLVDGTPQKLGGIIVISDSGGGNTYFKLRDLGAMAGFEVGWTAEEGITIRTK